MRDYVLIYVNGHRHELRGARAFQTLSNFLRYDLGLVGTKVVCAEGDCGSCAVLVGRVDDNERLTYRAITSCIQFVYQLDAAHVVTVEGLKHNGALNPVQEAMVRCQGAQCGFCTPGFIVSMCGLLEEQEKLDENTLLAGLVGNLCRCTGYESILKAGMESNASNVKRLADLYPVQPLLAALREHAGTPVHVRATESDREFFKPVTDAQATEFKASHPNCVLIAGGTDLGVQVNKGTRDPAIILSLSGLSELRSITHHDDRLTIGALATLADVEHHVEPLSAELTKMFARHGSPLIRNAGTLAGNIANASPIGDSMPALFVLNAEIELTGRAGARRVNMNDFYTGYRKTVIAADELITRVIVPLPKAGEYFRLYKVSKRHDLDISTFTAAFWMRRENGVIAEIRIAYGGCGPVIYRLRKTEDALTGKPLNESEFDAATEIARGEIAPISDVRGDADYRLQLAENILRKFFFDVTGVETYERVTGAKEVDA
ncbi:MAG: xanthine dehydrogenase small subunit [Humisphaera sp.]|nr:xanthine dehydrogenase small subunit [Humisphaera sp.]